MFPFKAHQKTGILKQRHPFWGWERSSFLRIFGDAVVGTLCASEAGLGLVLVLGCVGQEEFV